MGQILQGGEIAERYYFWFGADNAAALLSAQHLSEMECLPPEWRVPAYDMLSRKELEMAEQICRITAVIGEDAWTEVAMLRALGLIEPDELYERLCDAITRRRRLPRHEPKPTTLMYHLNRGR